MLVFGFSLVRMRSKIKINSIVLAESFFRSLNATLYGFMKKNRSSLVHLLSLSLSPSLSLIGKYAHVQSSLYDPRDSQLISFSCFTSFTLYDLVFCIPVSSFVLLICFFLCNRRLFLFFFFLYPYCCRFALRATLGIFTYTIGLPSRCSLGLCVLEAIANFLQYRGYGYTTTHVGASFFLLRTLFFLVDSYLLA
eukprot:gene4939-3544_t